MCTSPLFCIKIKNDTLLHVANYYLILRKVFYAALIHDCLSGSVQHKTDFRK